MLSGIPFIYGKGENGMFKSVFAKYVSTFMVIILVSFTIIALAISTTVNDYAESAKMEIMENAAHSSAKYIEGEIKRSQTEDLGQTVELEKDDIRAMLTAVSSSSEDLTLLITDRAGAVILAEGVDREQAEKTEAVVPEELMNEIIAGNDVSKSSELKNMFNSPRYIYAAPVIEEGGEVCGTVFVCAQTGMLGELLNTILKTIVVSILLVFLATLIAVFIVTDRITTPLKEIGRAAKSFAAGKFDVRVPVRGQDEIAEVAVAFNNMAESLNNYDKMRNTFMSNVSHDLRTPMTSISGFVDGILDGVIPPEKQEYYLQIVSSEVKRLSRLVSTLLDISRIQAGERKFTMTHFDICEMGREIIISFEQKINEKHLDVDFEVDDDNMTVSADRDAIYQIFYNLCDNAVKFASEGGKFKVEIKKLKGKKVLVSVFKEGQGIAEEDMPYVFDRFYKSDKSRGLNKTGAGLGLFISKTIVEAHGEKIWVESEYGNSCCFNFTLSQDQK